MKDHGAGWLPTVQYKNLLLEGAKEHKLDAGYQKWLAGVPPESAASHFKRSSLTPGSEGDTPKSAASGGK